MKRFAKIALLLVSSIAAQDTVPEQAGSQDASVQSTQQQNGDLRTQADIESKIQALTDKINTEVQEVETLISDDEALFTAEQNTGSQPQHRINTIQEFIAIEKELKSVYQSQDLQIDEFKREKTALKDGNAPLQRQSAAANVVLGAKFKINLIESKIKLENQKVKVTETGNFGRV